MRLVAADDGYEPARTPEAMKQLYDRDQVFGFIGNVGTPTAVVATPFALERRMLFFGAFTGGLLRRDPPDRYVFNYRASYAEETYASVRYLVKVRKLKPEQMRPCFESAAIKTRSRPIAATSSRKNGSLIPCFVKAAVPTITLRAPCSTSARARSTVRTPPPTRATARAATRRTSSSFEPRPMAASRSIT